MAGSYPDNVNPGLFLPTTPMFDVGDLDNKDNLKQLVVQLAQFANNIASATNLKDTGMYVQEQFVNGQTFFPNPALSSSTAQSPTMRQVFRQVFLFGQLPNIGTIILPHNIAPTADFTFTRIYGVANDTTGFNYVPIPSTVAGQTIFSGVTAANVFINTNFDATPFDQAYIIVEWLAS